MKMAKIEEMLEEILESQRRLADEISKQHKLIRHIEERLKKLEMETPNKERVEIPPSLIRVLKGLVEANKPVSAEEAAKRISLSRNLTSGYLNRLADLGYVVKEPNLEGKGARYMFRINYAAIPEQVKQLLKKYGERTNG